MIGFGSQSVCVFVDPQTLPSLGWHTESRPNFPVSRIPYRKIQAPTNINIIRISDQLQIQFMYYVEGLIFVVILVCVILY